MIPTLGNELDVFLHAVFAQLGTWYKWGGDDPAGFDCSGLVVEGLKAAGLMPRQGDATADMLYHIYEPTDTPRVGCLVFWGSSAPGVDAGHVEIVVGISDTQDTVWTIGASGGGSQTLTVEDAVAHNAFVKIRPERSGAIGYRDPFADLR